MNFEMDQAPGTEYLIFRCAQLGKDTYGGFTIWGPPPTMVISVYRSKDEEQKTIREGNHFDPHHT